MESREKKPSGQHSGDVRRTGNGAVAISSTVTAISRQVEVRKSTEGSERWWDLTVSRVPFLMALRPAVDVRQPDLSVCVKGCVVLPSVRRPPHLSCPGEISEMMNSPCQILSSLRSTAAYLISAGRPLERFKMVGTIEASGLSGRLKCGRSPLTTHRVTTTPQRQHVSPFMWQQTGLWVRSGDYINNNVWCGKVRNRAVPWQLQLYIGPGQEGDHGNGNRNYKKPEQVQCRPVKIRGAAPR